MTALYFPAETIAVTLTAFHMPAAFEWREQRYRVDRITHHWRIRQGWWQEAIHREFYRLATEDGLLVILYCDLLTDQWYLLRVYD